MQVRYGQDRTSQTTADRPRGRGRRDTPHLWLKSQLIQLLKDGSEYFTPEEVRWIVRAARLRIKKSLNAIDILEENVQYFANAFSDTDPGELREQCRETIQEYKESMRVWKEMKDTGDLCTSDTDSEEEDKLTREGLLQTLNEMWAAASPVATPKAESSNIDWPKRVLQQTILVSSIASEIEADTGRADWDKSSYEECCKLFS
jgi:hypothetical protein